MITSELAPFCRLLCRLQEEIRVAVAGSRRRGTARLSRIATVTAADTIYAVDRISERAVLAWFDRHWPRRQPVELVMEGLEGRGPVTFPRGTPVAQTRWKCILDPIDGTRGLMYDKRSAWSLAALAPQRGTETNLRDLVVAVMTELPTSKAGAADRYSAVRGGGVQGVRIDLRTGRRTRLGPRPSRARGVAHGFASLAKFFPEGKAWLATLEEKLWRELDPRGVAHGRPVFDDQYISTGGQLHELLAGHDRFIADL
ncbi:MAG: inositol monophosphatase, partial [Opitutales bacterium]